MLAGAMTAGFGAVSAISGARASGYPGTAVSDDEAVFAWTESEDGQQAALLLPEPRRSAR
jgi:hypothetical protein